MQTGTNDKPKSMSGWQSSTKMYVSVYVMYNLFIVSAVLDSAEMRHDGVTAAAADCISRVHVTRLCQLVEFDGDHVRIRLAPFLLLDIRCRCSCPAIRDVR